jgi:hypothetical protein
MEWTITCTLAAVSILTICTLTGTWLYLIVQDFRNHDVVKKVVRRLSSKIANPEKALSDVGLGLQSSKVDSVFPPLFITESPPSDITAEATTSEKADAPFSFKNPLSSLHNPRAEFGPQSAGSELQEPATDVPVDIDDAFSLDLSDSAFSSQSVAISNGQHLSSKGDEDLDL